MKAPCASMVWVALLLTGCTVSDGSPTSGGPPTASARAAGDCGSATLTQNGSGRIPDSMLSCFVGASRDNLPARLSVVEFTTEGDPIMTSYSSDADGKVTVVVDSRQDRYAGIGNHLTVQLCDHPTPDRGRLLLSSCVPK